jgi:hypothetical protein
VVEAWGLSFACAKALHDDFVPITLPLIAAWQSNLGSHPSFPITFGKGGGGMGIRTPDILLAKQTLYQLSYTPALRRQSR